MKVYITRKIPQEGIDYLRAKGYETTVWEGEHPMTKEEMSRAARQADALMTMTGERVDGDFLQNNSHLKVITNFGVGFDNIDIHAATRFGIPVGNTPEVLSDATADIAFILMLNVSRKILHHHKRILKGEWKTFAPTRDLGIELKNKTLGIFGMGRIGAEMARKCKGAFNMDIIYHNRNRNEEAEKELGATWVPFDTLLMESDVISVHAALTPETRKKFNAAAFSKMKPDAIFINTSRGTVVDQEALQQAVEQGVIWGAGLDVTDPEPMRADHPLLNMPTVVILPHIGSATREARTKMALRAAENIHAGLQGKILPYIVNKEVYGC